MAALYAARGWAMELHLGAIRNVNAGQFARLGPDTGYDVIAPCSDIGSLVAFLDSLENRGALPRIILYNLNPAESEALAALTGAFHAPRIKGKIQYGAAWWYNDTKAGNTRQIETLASYGVLGTFIGMLTDSRSFLSFPRHEYFRRILCDIVGRWVEAGEYPADDAMLEPLIKGICYENAREYFGFEGIDL
jgi:glucuronate isomerase